MEQKTKGAIFDLDGVVVDTAKYHYLAWDRLAGEMGFRLDSSVNERLKAAWILWRLFFRQEVLGGSHKRKSYGWHNVRTDIIRR